MTIGNVRNTVTSLPTRNLKLVLTAYIQIDNYVVINNQHLTQVIITFNERRYAATEPRIFRKESNMLRPLSAAIMCHKTADHVFFF
jgi:hypothetical protein